jgi:hypothetical protein
MAEEKKICCTGVILGVQAVRKPRTTREKTVKFPARFYDKRHGKKRGKIIQDFGDRLV